MSLCHVHRRALVANIDDWNAGGVHSYPQRHDVPAAKAKHPLYTVPTQYAGNEFGNRRSRIVFSHALLAI